MILESLVTTVDDEGHVNVAPMGPVVDAALTRFTLRPFKPSRTYSNLRATRRAVVHVTDNSLMFARAITGDLSAPPAMRPILDGGWWVLSDACRYFAVEISQWDDAEPRAEAECRIVATADQRPFFGFNRAKHAVIEAAILATRVHLIPHQSILRDLDRYQVMVDKTAGPDEHQAFEILRSWIAEKMATTGA